MRLQSPAPGEIDQRIQTIRTRFPDAGGVRGRARPCGTRRPSPPRDPSDRTCGSGTSRSEFPSAGRDALVRDWITGLRRRSDIVDLYKP